MHLPPLPPSNLAPGCCGLGRAPPSSSFSSSMLTTPLLPKTRQIKPRKRREEASVSLAGARTSTKMRPICTCRPQTPSGSRNKVWGTVMPPAPLGSMLYAHFRLCRLFLEANGGTERRVEVMVGPAGRQAGRWRSGAASKTALGKIREMDIENARRRLRWPGPWRKEKERERKTTREERRREG